MGINLNPHFLNYFGCFQFLMEATLFFGGNRNVSFMSKREKMRQHLFIDFSGRRRGHMMLGFCRK